MSALAAVPPTAPLLAPAEYLPFVEKIARRLLRRLPSHVRLEDLVSAGVVGLLEAMRRHDGERDFEAFAEFRVKGAILDELRRRDLMARDARAESNRIERKLQQLTSELGRAPEEGELAAGLGLSIDVLRSKLERLTPVTVTSVDDAEQEMPREESTPFDGAAKEEMREALAQAIGNLGNREQQVLHLYYQEELTLKEIGHVLEVSESRVCQIMSEATLRLRAMLGADAPKKKGGRRG